MTAQSFQCHSINCNSCSLQLVADHRCTKNLNGASISTLLGESSGHNDCICSMCWKRGTPCQTCSTKIWKIFHTIPIKVQKLQPPIKVIFQCGLFYIKKSIKLRSYKQELFSFCLSHLEKTFAHGFIIQILAHRRYLHNIVTRLKGCTQTGSEQGKNSGEGIKRCICSLSFPVQDLDGWPVMRVCVGRVSEWKLYPCNRVRGCSCGLPTETMNDVNEWRGPTCRGMGGGWNL